MKLSEKYIAGFLDSDGTCGIKYIRTDAGYKPILYVEFSQEIRRDKVLHLMRSAVDGGSVYHRGGYAVLNLPPKVGRNLLTRMSKHLVLKRHFAEECVRVVHDHKGRFLDLDGVHALKEHMKAERKRENVYPLPNYPTRKWVAGYFDGDGTIGVSYRKNNGYCYLSARIVADNHYTAGIRLLQKTFGGGIYRMKRKAGHSHPYWVMNLPPSKAKQFLGYFAKHSVVKRDELYFVLRCAEGGNYRDGKTIQQTIKHLKAQEQRLNDPGADIQELVDRVDFSIQSSRWKNRPAEYRVSDSPPQINL